MQNHQNHALVLNFIQNLPWKRSGFFRDVLSLFEQYFHVKTSLAITYGSNGTSRDETSTSRYKYIVRNLTPDQIRLYFTKYHTSDLYTTHRSKSGTVISLSELATTEELADLPYYRYLSALGIRYQTCIFLRDGKRLLATISLFRAPESGDFTPQELDMLRTIEPFLTKQYLRSMAISRDSSLLHYFDSYFEELNMGVAVLDRDRTVLKANQAFQDYATYILEHGTIERSFVTDKTVDNDNEYMNCQELLNHFGESVITKPSRIHIECILYLYHFHVKAFYGFARSDLDTLEQMYLVFLTRQEKVRSPEMLDAIKILTPRELTVLGYLASGMSNTEISDAMQISPFTVKTHLQNIYSKCNVSTRNELIAKLR